MKRNPRTAWRQYGETVLVITPDDRKVHELNETASFLWNAVGEGGTSPANLCEGLVKSYEVEPGQAKKDVSKFVKLMVQKAILEKEN
ncbi:MAG: PqqD family protein [Fibrobacterota bacterium]